MSPSKTYTFSNGDVTVHVEVPGVHDGTTGGPRHPEPSVAIETTEELDRVDNRDGPLPEKTFLKLRAPDE